MLGFSSDKNHAGTGLNFTLGGLIPWTCRELRNTLKGLPIETLIKSCLLEERSAESSFRYEAHGGSYNLKWTFNNDLGLLFVIVYQRILHLLYVDDLLNAVKREFSGIYEPKKTRYDEFDGIFRQLHKEAEARVEEMRKLKQMGKSPPILGKKVSSGSSLSNGRKRNGKNAGNDSSAAKNDGNDDAGKKKENVNNGMKEFLSLPNVNTVVKGKENRAPGAGAFDVNKLLKLKSKGGKKNDTNTTNMGWFSLMFQSIPGNSVLKKSNLKPTSTESSKGQVDD